MVKGGEIKMGIDVEEFERLQVKVADMRRSYDECAYCRTLTPRFLLVDTIGFDYGYQGTKHYKRACPDCIRDIKIKEEVE